MRIHDCFVPLFPLLLIIGCRPSNLLTDEVGPYDVVVFNSSSEDLHVIKFPDAPGYIAAGELGMGISACTSQVSYAVPEKVKVTWEDSKGTKKESTVEIRSNVKDPDHFTGVIIVEFCDSGIKVTTAKTTKERFDYEWSRIPATQPPTNATTRAAV